MRAAATTEKALHRVDIQPVAVTLRPVLFLEFDGAFSLLALATHLQL